jgi:hypothetical protein
MIFPMKDTFHFSQQLFKKPIYRELMADPDPDLSPSLNQFHLPLKSRTFLKQIYTDSPNPSCAPKPLLTNPIAKPQVEATER